MSTVVSFVGFAAGTLTTLAFLPQVLHTWRLRTAEGLSWTTLVTFSVGVALWLIYGIALHAWPVIVANGVTLALQLPLVGMKLRDRGRRKESKI